MVESQLLILSVIAALILEGCSVIASTNKKMKDILITVEVCYLIVINTRISINHGALLYIVHLVIIQCIEVLACRFYV